MYFSPFSRIAPVTVRGDRPALPPAAVGAPVLEPMPGTVALLVVMIASVLVVISAPIVNTFKTTDGRAPRLDFPAREGQVVLDAEHIHPHWVGR